MKPTLARLDEVSRGRLRMVASIVASLVLIAPLVWMWQASLLPAQYSVMDMGYLDYGGGPKPSSDHGGGDGSGATHAGGGSSPTRSVTDFAVDPSRPADVTVDLVVRQETLTIAGKPVAGYTLNGTSPGPTISATEGELIEVRVTNASVKAGIALHWHGVDVPNSMDGVAGVTQDMIPVGGRFTYRFVAEQVGTYWYHSHQVSNPQVIGGLLGALVLKPKKPIPEQVDVIATAHTYNGMKTLNGVASDLRVSATPRQRVRIRAINTDNGPIRVWASTPYRVLAIDGYAVNKPGVVEGQSVTLTAGARVDLGITMPQDGSTVRVQISAGTAVLLGSQDATSPPQPTTELDLLSYGEPAPLGLDPAAADRRFEFAIGRRPGFVRGRPGMWWTVNGHLYPNVPMYVVREGDIVVMRITNRSGTVHPMHLHGHHAVVLARNGVSATGSPWWVDSLNVPDKTTFDIAFVADNPGVWMDHCHNLKHAAQGMVAHLMYEGVDTPFSIGGDKENQPE